MKSKEQQESLLLTNLTKLLPYNLVCHVENDENLYVLHGLVCEKIWSGMLNYGHMEYLRK